MADGKAYVWTDDHGGMRVGKTRVLLEGIIYGFKAGQSPESVRRSYPVLDLEEVYGAITYYLARKDEVEAYLLQREALWDQAEAQQERDPPPALRRVREFTSAPAPERGGAR